MAKKPRNPLNVPEIVPVFPLSGALLLPRTHRPLNIFEKRYLAMVDHALGKDRLIGMIQPVTSGEESPAGKVPLRQVGCLGRIVHFDETEDERYLIVLEGIARFETLAEVEAGTPFRQFRISTTPYAGDFAEEECDEDVDRKRFLEMIRNYADFAQLDIDWNEIDETATADLVNFSCMMSPYGAAEKQVLLEAETLNARAETLIAMAELEMARSRSGSTLQ